MLAANSSETNKSSETILASEQIALIQTIVREKLEHQDADAHETDQDDSLFFRSAQNFETANETSLKSKKLLKSAEQHADPSASFLDLNQVMAEADQFITECLKEPGYASSAQTADFQLFNRENQFDQFVEDIPVSTSSDTCPIESTWTEADLDGLLGRLSVQKPKSPDYPQSQESESIHPVDALFLQPTAFSPMPKIRRGGIKYAQVAGETEDLLHAKPPKHLIFGSSSRISSDRIDSSLEEEEDQIELPGDSVPTVFLDLRCSIQTSEISISTNSKACETFSETTGVCTQSVSVSTESETPIGYSNTKSVSIVTETTPQTNLFVKANSKARETFSETIGVCTQSVSVSTESETPIGYSNTKSISTVTETTPQVNFHHEEKKILVIFPYKSPGRLVEILKTLFMKLRMTSVETLSILPGSQAKRFTDQITENGKFVTVVANFKMLPDQLHQFISSTHEREYSGEEIIVNEIQTDDNLDEKHEEDSLYSGEDILGWKTSSNRGTSMPYDIVLSASLHALQDLVNTLRILETTTHGFIEIVGMKTISEPNEDTIGILGSISSILVNSEWPLHLTVVRLKNAYTQSTAALKQLSSSEAIGVFVDTLEINAIIKLFFQPQELTYTGRSWTMPDRYPDEWVFGQSPRTEMLKSLVFIKPHDAIQFLQDLETADCSLSGISCYTAASTKDPELSRDLHRTFGEWALSEDSLWLILMLCGPNIYDTLDTLKMKTDFLTPEKYIDTTRLVSYFFPDGGCIRITPRELPDAIAVSADMVLQNSTAHELSMIDHCSRLTCKKFGSQQLSLLIVLPNLFINDPHFHASQFYSTVLNALDDYQVSIKFSKLTVLDGKRASALLESRNIRPETATKDLYKQFMTSLTCGPVLLLLISRDTEQNGLLFDRPEHKHFRQSILKPVDNSQQALHELRLLIC